MSKSRWVNIIQGSVQAVAENMCKAQGFCPKTGKSQIGFFGRWVVPMIPITGFMMYQESKNANVMAKAKVSSQASAQQSPPKP